MATINIPERVFQGFNIISELKNSEIDRIINFINSFSIEDELENLANKFNEILGSPKGGILLQTIMSYSELIDDDNSDYKDIAYNLAESYFELAKIEGKNGEKNNLNKNLYEILSNYQNIKLFINSRKSSAFNENNLTKSDFFTDIRLVFNKEISDKNRYGIILHKLYVEYQRNNEIKEFHLTLDLDDLKKLKEQIEKSILKDNLIRNDYKDDFKFIIL